MHTRTPRWRRSSSRHSDGAAPDFALTGVITLLTFVFLPFYGRLTDLFGVRRVAVIGVVCLPGCWIAYAMMSGPMWQYFAITVAVIAIGVTTTPAIYSRVVATRFDRARGLALAIAISGPPLLGAIAAPALEAVNRAVRLAGGLLGDCCRHRGNRSHCPRAGPRGGPHRSRRFARRRSRSVTHRSAEARCSGSC